MLVDSQSLNIARSAAAETLVTVLQAALRREETTERELAEAWHKELLASGVVTTGWYQPPPNGIAILSGTARSQFGSLRDQQYWPSDNLVDFANGVLYAYSSPIDRRTGLIGDLAVTLYFGSDPIIQRHFELAKAATEEVLGEALTETSSRRLFEKSNDIFDRHGFKNCVLSQTDTTPLDLGHSFPTAPETQGSILPLSSIEGVSRARKFINGEADWVLDEAGQFTVEPQLMALSGPNLPQVTFHYVVDRRSNVILREPDDIMLRFATRP